MVARQIFAFRSHYAARAWTPLSTGANGTAHQAKASSLARLPARACIACTHFKFFAKMGGLFLPRSGLFFLKFHSPSQFFNLPSHAPFGHMYLYNTCQQPKQNTPFHAHPLPTSNTFLLRQSPPPIPTPTTPTPTAVLAVLQGRCTAGCSYKHSWWSSTLYLLHQHEQPAP